MEIEIHGFNATIRNMPITEIDKLCSDYLGLEPEEFDCTEYGNYKTMKYKFIVANGNEPHNVKEKESVVIKFDGNKDVPYVFLRLKGSFFDCSPKFRLDDTIKFLSKYDYKPTQLDVAFNDDKSCLTEKNVRHWCDFSYDNCTGTLVRRMPPEVVTTNKKLSRIQLGKASSKVNHGTIYIRPDTECFRFEIKIKDEFKIMFLLKKYNATDTRVFNKRSKRLLVTCINFVTAASKRKGCKAKYKMTGEWKAFLGSEVKPVNWSKLCKQKVANRTVSDKEVINKRVQRITSLIKSTSKKLKSNHAEKEVLNAVGDNIGFKLVKTDTEPYF
ncbi:hypothetical protein [Pelobacter propionicus]|uniref:Uncharacterized protein n=1 Tax=Pelobacter propionicus (strain DSM 2379 / NBRC 103807 / OttBd1) TaxID=338966 RepID=A1AQ89_PELPD|nr:hypothetical protein [Pelobacter propionicus]ABK99509.1 hypothetical protein Ppro_1899 [Pelobacter propionicus DSM 2379]